MLGLAKQLDMKTLKLVARSANSRERYRVFTGGKGVYSSCNSMQNVLEEATGWHFARLLWVVLELATEFAVGSYAITISH